MKKLIFCIISVLLLLPVHATLSTNNYRIISLGGSVTEVIYALHQEKYLVAVDRSSIYPAAANQLPKVGYYRSVPVEGVAALNPTLILASEQAGPKKSLSDLHSLGIQIETITDAPRVDAIYQRISQIAKALNVPEQGKSLIEHVQADINTAQALPNQPLKTILIMSHTGTMMAAGKHTAANELMTLAGVKNVFEQQGYKPISAESLAEIHPELIIITKLSVDAAGGIDAIKALPAFADSPAVKNNRILVMDDLLALALGPRTGEAIRQIKAISQ